MMQLRSEWTRQPSLWVVVLLPALLAFAVFLNTVQNGFVYDDVWKIQLLPTTLPPLRELLSLRSITYFSQVLDRMLWGETAPGFHLTNVVLHALASGLAALAAFSLANSRRLALLTGLLFAIHPVHVEAVASFSNRKDILAMIFVALALMLWRSRRFSPISYVMAWVCFGLGFLSKEVAVIGLVPMFFLADLTLSTQHPSGSSDLRRAFLRILPFGLLVTGVAIRLWHRVPTYFSAAFISGITDHQLQSYQQVLANSAAAIPDLFRLLFWPLKLSADYPPIRDLGLASPPVFFGVGLLLAWIAVATLFFRRAPIATFAMLWPVITYIACSNLVPLNRFFIAERYLYVPSFGVCLLLGYLFNRALGASAGVWRRGAFATLFMLLLVAGGWRSHQRNRDWRDGPSLWSSALKAGYATWRTHYNLGFELRQVGEYDRAVDQFEASLEYFPGRPEIESVLVTSLILADRHDRAERLCREILKRRRNDPDCHYAGAIGALSRSERALAIESSERALAEDPNHLETLVLLARIYATAPEEHLRNGDRSVELSERALRLTRDTHEHPEVLWAMALSQASLGDSEAARKWGLRALNLARVRGMKTLSAEIKASFADLDSQRNLGPVDKSNDSSTTHAGSRFEASSP